MEVSYCNMKNKSKYKIKSHYVTKLNEFVDKLDNETKKIINGIDTNRNKA